LREINGIIYYCSGDVSALINKSRETIVLYDVLSDFWEKEHGERFIPKPIRVNGQRLFTKEQVREIKRFAETKKCGELARAKKEYEAKKIVNQPQTQKQRWASDEKGKKHK
jgi:predicted NAD-dependent protein-ADP-ribosyltransferase YbiA (DUF1768 family)